MSNRFSVSGVLFDTRVIESYKNAGHVISSYSLVSIWSKNLLEKLFNAVW